jgi:hypothetical protein
MQNAPSGSAPHSGVVYGNPLIQIPDDTGKTLFEYIPQPKQWEFHLSPATRCLMGGVRGTGKSHCMRMDAHVRALTHPGFKYLILRRKFPDLLRTHLTHLDREMRLLGEGYFNKTERIAHYPNGSEGHYGHCENDEDVQNYLSAEYGAIYFDELSTFSFDVFTRICGSARVPKGAGYKAIIRGGTNPGGENEAWIMEWFVNKNVDPSTYKNYKPEDWHYIHTVVGDNQHLSADYYENLAIGNPHLYRQWVLGEWGVQEDGYFTEWQQWREFDDDGKPCEPYPWHVINELPKVKDKHGNLQPLLSQPWINIYRAVDWGFSPDPAVCLWIAVLPNGQAIVFKERTWLQTPATEVAKDIVRESQGMRIVDTFADPSMWFHGDQGWFFADQYESNGVSLSKSLNDRTAIGVAIHEHLNTRIDGKPKVQVFREGCPELIRTLPQQRSDKNNPTRIADGDDHWTMALGYFCLGDTAPSRPSHEQSKVPLWMRKKPSNASYRYGVS